MSHANSSFFHEDFLIIFSDCQIFPSYVGENHENYPSKKSYENPEEIPNSLLICVENFSEDFENNFSESCSSFSI